MDEVPVYKIPFENKPQIRQDTGMYNTAEEKAELTKTQSSAPRRKKILTVISSLVLLSLFLWTHYAKIMASMAKDSFIEALHVISMVFFYIFIVLMPVFIYHLDQIYSNAPDKKWEAPPSLLILLGSFALRFAVLVFQIWLSSSFGGYTFNDFLMSLYVVLISVVIFAPMLMLGSKVSNFSKQCRNTFMNPSGNTYMENCKKHLMEYQSIKAQSQFGLFLAFTCLTIDLIIYGFLGLASVQGCVNISVGISVCASGVKIGCLTYYAYIAQKCHSSLLELAEHSG